MKTAGNNRKTTSNRVALYGLLIALAFVLSYVETLFPVYLGAPGVKLGLANLVTVIALYGLGVKEAFAINVVRVLLSGFTFGNMSGVSACQDRPVSGVHLWTKTFGVFSYLPVLLIAGTVAGDWIGLFRRDHFKRIR